MKRLLTGAVFMLSFSWSSAALAQSSTCQIQDRSDGPRLELVLDRLYWEGWEAFCDALAPYLDLPARANADAAERTAARLRETTFFDSVQCVPSTSGQDMRCTLVPAAMVRRVKITGDIPFALLKRSVSRRVFLRPGLVLNDDPGVLDRQRRRLEEYLEGEGFFGAKVALELEPDKKGEPARAVRVNAKVEGGEPGKIRGVSVAGASPISHELADKRVRHFVFLWLYQDRFRPKQLETDLEHLEADMRERGFPAASAKGRYERNDDGSVNVFLDVDGGPWLDMTFEGNEHISAWRLRRLATFSKTGTVDGLAIEDLRKEILKAYQKKGRFDTTVESDVRTLPDRVRLEYQIHEGHKRHIRKIRFEGIKTFSDDRVRRDARLATQAQSGPFNPGYWVDEYAARDTRAIAAFYREHGFEHASVEVERTQSGRDIEVTFKVEEGSFQPVRDVSMNGLPALINQAKLLRGLITQAGGRFSTAGLARDEQRIVGELLSMGYLKANVSSSVEPETDAPDAPVQVRFDIEPGRRFEYGGVFIRGNFRTHPRLIRNTIGLKRGDPLDLVALGKAKKQLRELGVFSGVDLTPLPATEDGEIWLLASLEERERRALEFFATWETDDKGALGATWRDTNFLGRAILLETTVRVGELFRYIPIRVDPGFELPFGLGVPSTAKLGNVNEVEGRARAPHPFGLPFDVTGTAQYLLDDAANAREEKARAQARLSRALLARGQCRRCPDIVGSFFYQLSTQRKVVAGVLDAEKQTNVGKIGVTGVAYRKDSLLDPRHGYQADVRLELAHKFLAPGLGAATFWKVSGEYRIYRRLISAPDRPDETATVGPLVFASSLRLGAADAFGAKPAGQENFPEPRVPESDAFSYGGDYSFRGAEKDASIVAYPNAEFLFLSRSELRWYVLENLGFGALQVAFFTDVASVSYNVGDLFKDTAVSLGPGFRFLTPVGPISVEYAWAVVRPEALTVGKNPPLPPNGRFHVTFGYQF